MGTKYHGKATRIIAGGFNASGALNTAEVSGERDLSEVTTFSDGGDEDDAKDYLAGKAGYTMSMTGYMIYDASTDDWEKVAWDAMGAGAAAPYVASRGSTAGDDVLMVYGRPTTLPVTFPISDAIGMQMSIQGDRFGRGELAVGGATVTATGAQTGVSFKALNSGDLIMASFHVVAVDTPTALNWAGKIEHSTDSTDGTDGTWADVTSLVSGTLTDTDSAMASATLAGTVGPWFRLNTTTFSGATSVTVWATILQEVV